MAHFIQPDSIIPGAGDALSYDRYAYVKSNPILYTDPSGHVIVEGTGGGGITPCANNDLTQWLTEAAVYMANSDEMNVVNEYIQRYEETGMIDYLVLGMNEFVSVVKDGGKFDVKDNIKQYMGTTIKLGDFQFENSTSGNKLYGFYGAAAGWDLETLHVGAGAAQTMDWLKSTLKIGDHDENVTLGPAKLYFDTAGDYYAVELGYILYEENYLDDNVFTAEEFGSALSSYEHLDEMDLVPALSIFRQPPIEPYAPWEFNND